MVVSAKLLPMEGSTLMVVAHKGTDGRPFGESVLSGSFTPMVSNVAATPAYPPGDVTIYQGGRLIASGSARWSRQSTALAGRLGEFLERIEVQEDSPLSADEVVGDLRAFLLALQPTPLTHITSWQTGPGLGYGGAGGLAVIWMFRPGWGRGGDTRAAAGLQAWIDAWRAQGRPGLDGGIWPVIEKDGDAWSVALRLSGNRA